MDYSEKVMEIFQSPKNIGEIKDADAVGKVGNPTCLVPTEKIHLNSGLFSISSISKSSEVLSHTGYYNGIIGSYRRKYVGKILKFTNCLGEVSLTPEHLIYAIKKPKGDKYLRYEGKKKLIPAWYHAQDLQKGDIVLYPIQQTIKDVEFLELDIPRLKYDFRSAEIPKKIPLKAPLLRLFGYYLAEGSIVDKPSKTDICFSLHIKEKDIAKDISTTVKNLFSIEVKIEEIPERNTLRVFIYNARIARWFKIMFGTGAENKIIPDFIMNLPLQKQKSLIYGIWRGDGYLNVNRKSPRAGYVTVSYKMLHQMKSLLLRQKIAMSLYTEKEKTIMDVKHKEAYRIHVGQRNSLLRLCNILNVEYKPNSYESVTSWYNDRYFFTPITKIQNKDYDGIVYNLEVNETHSFVSEAFCLHNCGDLMWIYLKFGKDEKTGEQIIADVKVKTFGCVAAIATSSILTEMIMGKPVSYAESLKKSDIVDQLQGLPPQKLHCSVLALDALKDALESYRAKK